MPEAHVQKTMDKLRENGFEVIFHSTPEEAVESIISKNSVAS